MTVIPAHELDVELSQHKSHGECPHCGGIEQTVWGYLYYKGATRALYYVRWTVGRPKEDLVWLVCWGPWGEGSTGDQRRSVGLRLRRHFGIRSFMVVDAATTPWGLTTTGNRLGSLLRRDEVVGTSLAPQVYACVDAVFARDPRVAQFLSRGEGVDGYEQIKRGWWPFRQVDWRHAGVA